MDGNVVLTGATGFIGSAVLRSLVSSGSRPTVLLRLNSSLARLSGMTGFDTLTYSGMQDERTMRALEQRRPDIFIHCGWRGVGARDRHEAFQITENVPMTLDTVELAAAAGCRQWIGLGSHAEYGNQNCRLTEDAPTRPTTTYGKAKLAAGVAALALAEVREMAGLWLRIFSTYGPGDSPEWLISYVIHELLALRAPQLTRCEQFWDYLFVDDAASAIVAAADGRLEGVFNLGSGTASPLKDYVETVRNELHSPLQPVYGSIPYRPDQVMHLEADISRFAEATGWKPRTSIEDGIRSTVGFERERMQQKQHSSHLT